MAEPTDIITGRIWEDGGATVLARVLNSVGTRLQQADVTTISYKIFDLQDSKEILTGTLDKSVVIAASAYQTDARWTIDDTGYNFIHAISHTAFPEGDRVYRIEYIFAATGLASFVMVVELDSQAIMSS